MPAENVHTTVEQDLTDLLPHIPPFGVFEPTRIFITDHVNGSDVTWLRFDKNYVAKMCEFLVHEGFADRRFDLAANGMYYATQLTEKGRALKKLGSLHAFNQMEARKVEEALSLENDRRMAFQRNVYQFWVNCSIAISTGVAAVYYLFALFDFYEKHHVIYQHVAYFLSGAGSSLLVWLALWQLRKVTRKL